MACVSILVLELVCDNNSFSYGKSIGHFRANSKALAENEGDGIAKVKIDMSILPEQLLSYHTSVTGPLEITRRTTTTTTTTTTTSMSSSSNSISCSNSMSNSSLFKVTAIKIDIVVVVVVVVVVCI